MVLDKIYINIIKGKKIWKNIRKYTKIYENIRKYTKIYKNYKNIYYWFTKKDSYNHGSEFEAFKETIVNVPKA